jgi:hydroxymethylbilane synthase
LAVSLEVIKTTGDKILDVPLAMVGGKGLFVKEIEEALLERRVDLAVHSMKDVPVVFPEGLHMAVITQREDPRDVLISKSGKCFQDLPQGARVGTSSLRRMAQLLHHRPDLQIVALRGNLDTRLKKLDQEGMDAIVLAAAGIRRLGWEDRITEYLPPSLSLPAIGQGALGLECRIDDRQVHEWIRILDDVDTHVCVNAERAFLARLEGGCQVPIAAHGTLSGGRLRLQGLVAGVDGTKIIRGETEGTPDQAEAMGRTLAERLLDQGAAAILKEVYGNVRTTPPG